MKLVNIVYGNHGSYVVIQDHIEYLTRGLTHIGARVQLHEAMWFPTGINLIIESNDRNDAYNQLVNLKRQYPQGKLILVATEVIKDNRFNSSNSTKNSTAHVYDNMIYWQKRFADFLYLLPYIDGIVCVSETLLDSYKDIGKPVFYLPMAAPRNLPRLERAPVGNRYIDFLFTGTLTPHRQKLRDKLASYGCNVVALPTTTSDFYRSFYHQHSKMIIGPRLDESTTIISKARAYYTVSNRLPHIFEKTPDWTDIHPHVHFCYDNSTFIEESLELVKSNPEYDEENFVRFAEDKNLNYEEIFRSLYTFMA